MKVKTLAIENIPTAISWYSDGRADISNTEGSVVLLLQETIELNS